MIMVQKKMTYETKRTKISESTGTEITRMLVNVMDKAIQGGNAKIRTLQRSGKTGTAQVADSVNGGYYENRHTHSFCWIFSRL